MDEAKLIKAIASTFTTKGERVVRTIGDDAAVVKALPYAVVTVDNSIDGVTS